MRLAVLALLATSALVTPAIAQDGSFPVTVTHALGETTIPAAPQRVVTLIDRDTDTVLALGIVPVGINSRFGFASGAGPWSEELLGDAAPTVWTDRAFNYEAILAAEPDLIVNVTSGGDPEEHARLSAIAPTLALPAGAVPWGATTEESLRLIAEALGREAEGEALLADLDAYYRALRGQFPQLSGLTANYFDIVGSDVYSYADDHVINDILYRAGFAPIDAADLADGESTVIVSLEQLDRYDADVSLVYTFGRTREALLAELPQLETWSSAARGTLVVLDDLALSASSVVSIPYALDRLMPEIASALE